MNNNILTIALGTMISLSACSDFLDTVPKGKVIPTTVEDFGMIINDPSLTASYDGLPYFGSDDVQAEKQSINMTTAWYKAYFWQDNFYRKDETDYVWNDLYKYIYTTNLVLENVYNASGGTDAEKNRIASEAKIQRAYYYWVLQSLYGPASNNKNAGAEMSVPMPLTNNLEAVLSRANMTTVNTQILNDLNGLDAYLPAKGSNLYKPNKASAWAIKARVLFYMGEYDQAAEAAQHALDEKSDIDDMRQWEFAGEYPSGKINHRKLNEMATENLWFHKCNGSGILRLMPMSSELKALYEKYPNDLRLKFYFSPIDNKGKPFFPASNAYCFIQTTPIHFISVAEMMLIKAEAMARKNDAKALDILNELRKYRFAEEDFQPLTKADGKDLLQIVLDERRRELAVYNLRWFDMKRLAAEGLYTKTLTRTTPDNEKCTLEPNSDKYLFPIPLKVMLQNPNIQPNSRQHEK